MNGVRVATDETASLRDPLGAPSELSDCPRAKLDGTTEPVFSLSDPLPSVCGVVQPFISFEDVVLQK